jgi:hypothetical protein
MLRDENAVCYVGEALEQGGYPEVVVDWLTAALEKASRRRAEVAGERGTPAYQDAAVIAFALARARHRMRRDLDLPRDDLDGLAERLRAAADEIVADADDECGYEGVGGAVVAGLPVLRMYHQPERVQQGVGEAVQQSGQERSIGRANRILAPPSCRSRIVIWWRRAKISTSLSRSLIASSRSIANPFVTAR